MSTHTRAFHASSQAGKLQLGYVFQPNPNPLFVSPKTGNLNTINLRVIVSKRSIHDVKVRKITIAFPIGEDTAFNLSPDPKLPQPSRATPGEWNAGLSSSGIEIEI